MNNDSLYISASYILCVYAAFIHTHTCIIIHTYLFLIYIFNLFRQRRLRMQKIYRLRNIGNIVVWTYAPSTHTLLISACYTCAIVCIYVIFNTCAVPCVYNNRTQQTAFHASFLSLKRIKRTRVNLVYTRLFVC